MDEIIDFTVNGACSNCGQCRSDILPLTPDDIQRIKRYVTKNRIQPIERKYPFMNGTLDMGCPFRDDVKRICTVYPVRPWICRAFRCDQAQKEIEQRKVASIPKTTTLSLWHTVFGDERNIAVQSMTQDYINATRGHHKL